MTLIKKLAEEYIDEDWCDGDVAEEVFAAGFRAARDLAIRILAARMVLMDGSDWDRLREMGNEEV